MKPGDWIDDRTGYRALVRKLLYEPIPGGARWRYVWGSTLSFVFGLQVVTGLLLMTVYSPSEATAWGSVWYIQTQMTLGWLIRGLHHFGSQAMILLMPVHMLQVVFAKAYRRPREFNWWLGLALLGVVLGLALTGYLLPWDQKGFWATKVSTNIMGLTPVVGGLLQRLVVAGHEYGNLTLARFFTLHVMVLPGTLVLLLAAHIALFRRHGVSVAAEHAGRGDGNFWPDQLWRDSLACLGVLIAMLAVVGYTHGIAGDALLDAPADPSASDYPARPEWYFLFLFELLKHFEGPRMEVFGAIVLPGLVAGVLLAVPLFDKLVSSRWAHRLAVGTVVALLGGVVWLTVEAVGEDRDPPDDVWAGVQTRQARGDTLDEHDLSVLRARRFHRQRAEATRVAERALALAAANGIPPGGPLELIAGDYVIRGPQLFARHCAACHRFAGHDGMGNTPHEPATSSDLAGYGRFDWIRTLLHDPTDDRHFGRMTKSDGSAAHTRMEGFLEDLKADYTSDDDRRLLDVNFDCVAAYLADEARHPGRFADIPEDKLPNTDFAPSWAMPPDLSSGAVADDVLIRGRSMFVEVCHQCHSYRGEREGSLRAPDMFGYGSVDWIEEMIADPGAESRYRRAGREPAQMPAFKDRLSERDRRLIARWLVETAPGPAQRSLPDK